MSKVAVVYWSGTGNTEQMAESVADGARNAGADVTTFTAAEFDADKMDEFDAIAFGCPSMVLSSLRKMSLSRCLQLANQSCPARRSLFLAPMDGEMVSGCATGMRPAAMTAL